MNYSHEIVEDLLTAPGYVSGEDISRKLGISRAAVWKRISRLRGQGFRIESHPRRGYLLVGEPDLLLPPLIKKRLFGGWLGARIHHYLKLESTNTEAVRLALEGSPEGTVVIAEEQTSGRGRRGRSWFSPPRGSLLFSLILRPAFPPDRLYIATFGVSLAVVDAVLAVSGVRPRIKWPNDIIFQDAKLGGVLTEYSGNPERLEYVVLGVGLNVNWPASRDRRLAKGAVSLKEILGRKTPVDRLELFCRILVEFERNHEAITRGQEEEIRRRWLENVAYLGERVAINTGEEEVFGTFAGIDEQGRLILQKEGEAPVRVACGDLLI